jgi:hypothetical protein
VIEILSDLVCVIELGTLVSCTNFLAYDYPEFRVRGEREV